MRIEYAHPVQTGVTSAMAVGDTADTARAVGQEMMKPWRIAVSVAAAYHGYRRSRSIGWTMGWMLASTFAPFITIGVAVAQGFGKPAR